MPIADNLAGPIVKTAAKAYVRRYDPNKPTFQLIFHELPWGTGNTLEIQFQLFFQ